MSDLKDKLDELKKKSKERTVKSLSYDISLETLLSKLKKKIIKLNPDYQRRHRWTEEMSSRLIESLILNIPLPIIFISQDIDTDEDLAFASEDARYTVIDGQQRLTAIYSFFSDDLSLSGLKVLSDLNGMNYKSLPQFLQRRLDERTIKVMEIDSTVDEEVKYDIFERINTGSVKLEPQEIRNCVYRGRFNVSIKKLAENHEFLRLIGLDVTSLSDEPRYRKMEDVELVLRFFALTTYDQFKSDFKGFLDSKQKEFNVFNETQIRDLEEKFAKTIRFVIASGIEFPFAKWKCENGEYIRSSKFNAAVYDAVMVGVCLGGDLENHSNISKLNQDALKSLFSDESFFDSVDVSTNRPEAIKKRIEKIKAMMLN